MKILMVISQGHAGGGAENSIVLMKTELTKRGHEVKILSANTSSPTHKLFSDYQFNEISPTSPFKALQHLFYLDSYRQLKRAIEDFQPDLVHFHTLASCSPSVLFATGTTPAVMTVHGPEEFTLKLIPWFLDPTDFRHADFDMHNLTLVGRLHYWYYRLLQRPVYRLGLRRLKAVIAPSRYILDATTADFAGAPMTLVPNGVDLPQPHPIAPGQTLLFVGRIEQLKGITYLLEAFAKISPDFPDLKLRIVGTGPHSDALKSQAAKLGVAGRTEFTGWVKPEMIEHEYAAATALVIPSVCPEAFGLVAIEAMAAARPVIGTSLGSLPELITSGKNGFIVPPANADALARTIKKLLSTPNLIETMSAEAAKSARHFSAGVFIDRLESVYTRVISHP